MARGRFLSAHTLGELNRLTYWIGLPALLVSRIATATPAFDRVGSILLVLVGTTAIVIAISALLGRAGRLPGASLATLVHASYRGNLTFVGLPVVIYAFAGGREASAVESAALIAFVPLVIVYNIVAVIVMQLPGQSGPGPAMRGLGRRLISNPILIATVLGMVIALAGWRLPVFMDRTLGAVGQMALPLALIGIGGGLYATRLRGQRRWAGTAALLKTVATPLIGWLLAVLVGLQADEMRLALIFLVCPTASAAYVLVQEMDGDAALMAGTIVLSYLLALPSMALVLSLTG
ncbi:AEC family transporter [Spiribacter curvatus]|uniref:AEC family transporter n=1 Tax=Spiribacter curvatus TaxID=1335757 RepID=UPI001F36F59F